MALGGLGGGGGGFLAGHARIEMRPDFSGFGPKLKTELKGVLSSVGGFNLGDVEGSFLKLGATSAQLGKTLSKNVTLPLVGLGAVAFKTAGDFETSFARMQALAGVTAGEVDGLRDSVLKISAETGRGPTELANGLYFLRSAGIAGKESIDALRASAKATAVGLGDTATITQVVATALNAYAKTGLTAAGAVDILAKTTQFAQFEASDLAPAIGRVIPLASAMGVSFDQVGAAMAVMSKQGLNADESATALRGIMAQLFNPTKEAADTLSSLGLSAGGLRQEIAEKGLLAGLNTMSTAFAGNGEAAAAVIGDIRALTGFLNITGQSGKDVTTIFDGTAHAAGTMDAGFKAVADTAQFKLNKALSQAKIALVDLGESAGPVTEKLIGAGGASLRFFNDLPGPIKTSTVAVGGLLAAAGPLTFLGGKISSSFGHITSGLGKVNNAIVGFRIGAQGVEDTIGGKLPNAAGRLSKALGPAGTLGALGAVGIGFTIGAIAIDNWREKKEEARQRVVAFTDALRADSGALGANTRELLRNDLSQKELLDDLDKLAGNFSSGRAGIDVYTDAVGGSAASQQEFRRAIIESGEAGIHWGALNKKQIKEVEAEWIRGGGSIQSAFDRLHIASEGFGIDHKSLINEFRDQTGAAEEGRKALAATADAKRTAADVNRELSAAETKLADLTASGTATEKQLGDARKRVSDLTAERNRIEAVLAGATNTTTGAIVGQLTPVEKLVDEWFALSQASDQAAAATAQVTAAQSHLADVTADARGTGPKSIDAANRQADALKGVRDAARSAADAQEKLADVRAKVAEFEGPTSTRIRELERTNIVHRIVSNPEEARQKELDLLKFDQDLADKRGDFQKSIADAEQGVADAAEKVSDAQSKVSEAVEARRKVQVDAAAEIAGAERDVHSAVNAVVDSLKQAEESGGKSLGPWLDALREIERLVQPGSPVKAFVDQLLATTPDPRSLTNPGQEFTGALPDAGALAAADAASPSTHVEFKPVYNVQTVDQRKLFEYLAAKQAMQLKNSGRGPR